MNISGPTLLDKKEKNSFQSPDLKLFGEKEKFYFEKKSGFIPLLLQEILEKRKQYLLYD